MLRYPRIAYPLTGDGNPFTGWVVSVLGHKLGVRGSIRLVWRRIIYCGSGVHIYWRLLIRSSVLVSGAYNDCAGKKSPRYNCRWYPTIIMTVPVIISGVTMVP